MVSGFFCFSNEKSEVQQQYCRTKQRNALAKKWRGKLLDENSKHCNREIPTLLFLYSGDKIFFDFRKPDTSTWQCQHLPA